MLVPAVEDIGRPEIVVDKPVPSGRPAAVEAVGVGRQRFVECRRHLTRLGDLCGVADVEEIAFDDGPDAERDAVQLDLKTTIACRNGSSDWDAIGLKPHPQGGCFGQTLEQRWRDGQLRYGTPVIGSHPGQQVSVADDKAVAVVDRDGPGVPDGFTHPAGGGKSIGEAESLGQCDCGVD
jgi:hypothetical protein